MIMIGTLYVEGTNIVTRLPLGKLYILLADLSRWQFCYLSV